ncbi:DUF3426 domain-containing protein [Massilia psychrophila]|jgi:predicted Zn finger-like uncharacterized protein|uniref:Zinc finger/thioredoxin putative domain-containing protein n=1 Tax=Massilia psychrophila TaxID=1603353 RepID=A0A2G8T6Y0_9BURK|nr:DUF3426 domain-containing protein [Massilia psychrophila]PIL41754.1 hypothetical protein CR103_01650 [Massilia psychrophila]GGE60461.1 membrane protein [Massilia psychrophila]
MALATICPHCNTTFRVASDQLKLRGGIVRCGACNEVFDGNAALLDLAAAAAVAATATATVPASAPSATPPSDDAHALNAPGPSASAAFDAEVAAIDARHSGAVAHEKPVPQAPTHDEPTQQEPIHTLDFDTTFDPFGILPKSLHPTAEPLPAPAPEPESPQMGSDPVLGQPVDQEILALPVLDDDIDQAAATSEPGPSPTRAAFVDFQPPLLMRASATAAPAPLSMPRPAVDAARKRKAEAHVAAIAPTPEPGEHEPEFVKISRHKARTGGRRRLVLGAACALLVLALAAQGVISFRNVLAARHPQAKALLTGACAVFGCKVELPAQIDALSVETGELQSLGANTFSFTTLLRNQASLVQAWPHLELALTDANDKPLVRRVFTPAEYLPQGVAPAMGIAPRSEQAVKLAFELNQVKASGYHIAIFYP